jgi:hypothetical protein
MSSSADADANMKRGREEDKRATTKHCMPFFKQCFLLVIFPFTNKKPKMDAIALVGSFWVYLSNLGT